jgi:hypothetical protein
MESSVNAVRVCHPKRYADVFSDADIDGKNNALKMKLMYKGVCEKTNTFLLSLEKLTL